MHLMPVSPPILQVTFHMSNHWATIVLQLLYLHQHKWATLEVIMGLDSIERKTNLIPFQFLVQNCYPCYCKINSLLEYRWSHDKGEFCIYFTLSYLVFCYVLSLFCGHLHWFYFVGEFPVKSQRGKKKGLKQASGRIGSKHE